MLGAIIGDVAGSIYEVLEIEERKNNKSSFKSDNNANVEKRSFKKRDN